VKVKLVGSRSNRSAIGSVVTVHGAGRTQSAPVLSQSSFLSLNDLRLHFGLGETKSIDRVSVQWPSGAIEEFAGVEPNSLVVLTEGAGKARAVPMKR
jgi:hypothetical protein